MLGNVKPNLVRECMKYQFYKKHQVIFNASIFMK